MHACMLTVGVPDSTILVQKYEATSLEWLRVSCATRLYGCFCYKNKTLKKKTKNWSFLTMFVEAHLKQEK